MCLAGIASDCPVNIACVDNDRIGARRPCSRKTRLELFLEVKPHDVSAAGLTSYFDADESTPNIITGQEVFARCGRYASSGISHGS
jgi:hypothetical protein